MSRGLEEDKVAHWNSRFNTRLTRPEENRLLGQAVQGLTTAQYHWAVREYARQRLAPDVYEFVRWVDGHGDELPDDLVCRGLLSGSPLVQRAAQELLLLQEAMFTDDLSRKQTLREKLDRALA